MLGTGLSSILFLTSSTAFFISPSLASEGFLLFLIKSTISSILFNASNNPKTIYKHLWRALGVALMALGVLGMALGVVTVLGALPAAVIPPGWAAIGIGGGISAAGLMLFDSGARCFFRGEKIENTGNMVKATNKLAKLGPRL